MKIQRTTLSIWKLLQNFQGEDFATEILKSELQKKTTLSHRINFFYKKAATGAEKQQEVDGLHKLQYLF